jgi:hypothetical protein
MKDIPYENILVNKILSKYQLKNNKPSYEIPGFNNYFFYLWLKYGFSNGEVKNILSNDYNQENNDQGIARLLMCFSLGCSIAFHNKFFDKFSENQFTAYICPVFAGNWFGSSIGGNFFGNYIKESDKKVINLTFNNSDLIKSGSEQTEFEQTESEDQEVIIKICNLTSSDLSNTLTPLDLVESKCCHADKLNKLCDQILSCGFNISDKIKLRVIFEDYDEHCGEEIQSLITLLFKKIVEKKEISECIVEVRESWYKNLQIKFGLMLPSNSCQLPSTRTCLQECVK